MDKVSSWPGTPAERGWRYLRHALESHDGPATEHRYSKAVLETILAHDRATEPPPWLITILEVRLSYAGEGASADAAGQEHHPEFLIRAHIRYENIDYALDSALSHLRKASLLAVYASATATDLASRRSGRSLHGTLPRRLCRHGYPIPSTTTSLHYPKHKISYHQRAGDCEMS